MSRCLCKLLFLLLFSFINTVLMLFGIGARFTDLTMGELLDCFVCFSIVVCAL